MTTEERLKKLESDVVALKLVIPDCLMFAAKAATLAAGAEGIEGGTAKVAEEMREIAQRVMVALGADKVGEA